MRTLKLFMAASLFTAYSWASIPAHPGMLNYVEGQANIDGQPVTNRSVGNADVEPGRTIETNQGKAEILLTPGVFLRLGDHSVLRMQNAGLADTSVELLHGMAMVEATDVHRENRIQVIDHGVTATLDKNGLYAFNADQPRASVYDGELTISQGDQHKDLKKGHQANLDGLIVSKFDTKQGDDLYRWSDLRSQYLSEASVASAKTFLVEPAGWVGGGWYWNPWWGFYSYLPGAGFVYSPFGWGFYGPRTVVYYPGRVHAGYVAASHPVAIPHAAFAGGFRGGRR